MKAVKDYMKDHADAADRAATEAKKWLDTCLLSTTFDTTNRAFVDWRVKAQRAHMADQAVAELEKKCTPARLLERMSLNVINQAKTQDERTSPEIIERTAILADLVSELRLAIIFAKQKG